jgi:hypothetical protein
MKINRDNAHWRQDDLYHHSLISDGTAVAVANHDNHSLTLMPQSDAMIVAIPHGEPLFETAEQRFATAALPIVNLPESKADAREAGRKAGELHRVHSPARDESRLAIQRAHDHLVGRALQAPLSFAAERASNHLRIALRDIQIHNGRWTDDAFSNFREAGRAFAELTQHADRFEQLAALEHNRAEKTLVHARSLGDRASDGKDTERSQQPPGRER